MAPPKYPFQLVKKMEYSRKIICRTCNGSKAKPGTQPQTCKTCKGTGYISIRQGMMVFRTVCNACNGEGKIITSPCNTCRGTGIETVTTTEEINFPKGIEDGANLKFRGKGHMNGDLFIKVGVRKHPSIKRSGTDAHSES